MEFTNTVLIVDDSEMIIKTLSFMIKKAGYNVLCANDGKNALELFDGREIDLVFTDLNMPNTDGIELITKIRSDEYYRYTPVVLFIPGDEKNRKEIIEKSGATMLFDKSDIKEKFIPSVKKMLS